MNRLVASFIKNGYIDVTARAYSIPEALAMESALRTVPPPAAYAVLNTGTNVPELEHTLPPEVAAQLEVIGSADPDATGLNHFTAQEVTTDD